MSFATGAAVFNSCNKAGAVGYFTRHLETNPRDWNALMWRAEAYNILGQTQNAAKDITRAIEVSTGVQRKLAMAEKKLCENDDVSDMISTYKGIVDEHPDCWKAWNKLGYLQKHTGDVTGALTSLRNAVDVATRIGESKDPGVCWIHLQLGLIWVEKGDIVTATDCFKSAIESSLTHTISHINLCEMNLLQGKFSDARQNFSTAIGLNPKLVKEVCGSETFDGYFNNFREKILALQNKQQGSKVSTSTTGNSYQPSASAYAQSGNNGKVSGISNRQTHQSAVVGNTRSGSSWGFSGIQNFVNWVFGWDNQPSVSAGARGGNGGAVGGISTGQRRQSSATGNASRSGNSGGNRQGYQSSVTRSSSRNSGGVVETSTRHVYHSSVAGSSRVGNNGGASKISTGQGYQSSVTLSSRSRNGEGVGRSSTSQEYQSPNAGSSRSGNYGGDQRYQSPVTGTARGSGDIRGASRISTGQGYQSHIPGSAGSGSIGRVGGLSTLRRYSTSSPVDTLSGYSNGGNNDSVSKASAAGRSEVKNRGSGSSKSYRYQSGGSGGRGGNNGGGSGSSSEDDDDFTGKDVNQIWKQLQKESPCIKMYKNHKYVQSKCGQFWFSRDTAGHGHAAFKRYDNTRNYIHFKDSLDENMRPMTNKHESKAGTFISKQDMVGVRG